MPHIGKLRDKGYSLEQIEQFLEARELLTRRLWEKEKVKEKPTIESLIRLTESFHEIEINAESIYGNYKEILKTLPRRFSNDSITQVIRVANSLQTSSLEATLDHIDFMKKVICELREDSSVLYKND